MRPFARLNKALADHHLAESEMEHGAPEARQKAIEAKWARFKEISAFYERFPELIKAHVRMLAFASGSRRASA